MGPCSDDAFRDRPVSSAALEETTLSSCTYVPHVIATLSASVHQFSGEEEQERPGGMSAPDGDVAAFVSYDDDGRVGGRGSRREERSSTMMTTKAAAVQRRRGGSKPMSSASRITTTTTTTGAISWDGPSPPLPLAAQSLSAPQDTSETTCRTLRGTWVWRGGGLPIDARRER